MSVLAAHSFASSLGVSVQAAREAFRRAAEGHAWRGEVLPVVALPGQRGGKGGTVWGLILDKCSPVLRAKLGAVHPALEGPVNTPVMRALQPWQLQEQMARLEAIQPILATDKRSTARDTAYRQAAGQPRLINGKIGYHAIGTLREWVRAFEAKGAAGLLPVQRKDRGEKRVLITREWDSGIDLPEAARAKIAQALNEKARSMVANDGTSNREDIRICEHWLACACIDAGSKFSRVQLAPLCTLNQKWAAQFDPYRLLHAKTKDHKAWQDFSVQRISRALPTRPMDVLIVQQAPDTVPWQALGQAPLCEGICGHGLSAPLGAAPLAGANGSRRCRDWTGRDRMRFVWSMAHLFGAFGKNNPQAIDLM